MDKGGLLSLHLWLALVVTRHLSVGSLQSQGASWSPGRKHDYTEGPFPLWCKRRTQSTAAPALSQRWGWTLCCSALAITLAPWHTSKVMLKILQARLQQYVNHELPVVQDGFRTGRGTRDQIASIHWIIEKARKFQKNIYFCFIDYTKAFDCRSQQTLENS